RRTAPETLPLPRYAHEWTRTFSVNVTGNYLLPAKAGIQRPKSASDRRGRHEARVFCAAGEAGSSRGVQTTPSCCLARVAGCTARSRLEQLLTVSPARRAARRLFGNHGFRTCACGDGQTRSK